MAKHEVTEDEMDGLSPIGKAMIKSHAKKQSKGHIMEMIKHMKAGRSFQQAHKIALEKFGN